MAGYIFTLARKDAAGTLETCATTGDYGTWISRSFVAGYHTKPLHPSGLPHHEGGRSFTELDGNRDI